MFPRKPNKHGNKFRSRTASYKPRQWVKDLNTPGLFQSENVSPGDKFKITREADAIDESMGFARYESGKKKTGWLINMRSTALEDRRVSGGRAGVDFYFVEEDGSTFKATVEYDPYFLIAVRRGRDAEVEEWCRRSFEGSLKSIKRVEKEDLQMPNHLLGYKRTLLQLNFANVQNLLAVRKTIMPIAEKNRQNMNAMDTYNEFASANAGFDFFDDNRDDDRGGITEASDYIVDIREYDVPYHVRVCIDKDIRIGKWYTVEAQHGIITLTCLEEREARADPVVLAYDIETTKLPLKFPDAKFDQIMMISYMIDGQGFLITNREIVSEDIEDFDYTPRPEYEGPFIIFNEPNERAVINRFFLHIKEARPTVISTYNGDFFDWPFVEARANSYGIDMYHEIGFRKNSEDIYRSNYCVHLDCFAWVNRDSYLPQGSRGLKAVTNAKLGYDPDELDPEVMYKYASERPQTLAEYSVSDAVATYYLYMKYVHPFIFSLCTVVPLGPDDTLRKGTGTLCEMLLMVQAYQKGIVLPNKHKDPDEVFWEGHLLESETYVGGHVESLECGVFRSDLPYNFTCDPTGYDELINDLDAALKFSITIEEKKNLEDVTNYDEIKAQVKEKLLSLKNTPNRNERPFIYHLDVASMYPNIMTTNRLQPDSMVHESDCAVCDFNRPDKVCDRRLPWMWRGEYIPAKRDEYTMIKLSLCNERFPGKRPSDPMLPFYELPNDEQAKLVKQRLLEYCKKIYHRVHDASTIEREAVICQRENPFYVNTVRDFRDRRYDFKGKAKIWKGNLSTRKANKASSMEIEEAKKMIVLYDSMQLAHKVILNSFYGYVMRKGSRWYSMEMAGVTCLTGATIIQMARELVDRIGRPLELDTDGIWCMLPGSFPENYSFKLKNGKKVNISYPCVMLNHLVHAKFTNHQYQTLVDPANFKYSTHSDNSIFFEVDGPYRAMVLPTSKEEFKNLKKRYAVFNFDGTLAELKGFEVKRRGELKLIKIFQTQIFKVFLEGNTLTETYAAVASVANKWLDVLYQEGRTLADDELMDLICENRSMTKALEEYGTQKSTSITTAKRLAQFLGEQMVKDKGLNCKYIIAAKPRASPVTERAIPVAIFSAEEEVQRNFLRKWLREEPGSIDPRSIIDWEYYLERLGSVIQKLITIPAALQKVPNPVPRVAHPDWLQKKVVGKEDRFKQTKLTLLFEKVEKTPLSDVPKNILDRRMPIDLEDLGSFPSTKENQLVSFNASHKRKAPEPVVSGPPNPYASLPSRVPSITEDYEAFLRYQKQKWKIQRQARARRRQLFGDRNNAGAETLGSYFRNQAELLFTNTWQILQLSGTDVPGDVRAFVLIDRKIHVLRIKVPRQVFLNIKNDALPDVQIEGCSVEKVNHTIPNGHPSVHLFKLSMPESVYIEESNKIAALFNHSSVEGVYETQVPLSMRAVLELGSLCTFDQSKHGALGRGLEHGFDLDSLRRVSSRRPYLVEPVLSYFFLYHVTAGERQVFALFSTVKQEAHFILLSRTKDLQNMPNIDNIYSELFQKKLHDSENQAWQEMFPYQESIHFKTVQISTKRKTYRAVSDLIKKMRNDETKPVMMVIQSGQRQTLIHEIPVLKEMPILPLKSDTSDTILPPLGWQGIAAKRLVNHYLALGSWVSHLTNLARYGDIPLGNLESDDPRFLIDVAYARRLQKNNIILWWSSSPQPDHAGYEKDDIVGPTETIQLPSVNNPGSYSSVCIEIDVRNLVINTILTSSLINELEGSESMLENPSAPTDGRPSDGTGVFYSEKAFTSAGITVLREMVKAWWTEACKGNSMADIMIQHLLRWAESPASALYDPSLRRYIQVMSKKAFQQLVMDFRRGGSHVVFASVDRLLLQTTKLQVDNAYAYCQYILKSIQSKPLFHFLDLNIKEYWDYLIWYDEFNYGGKSCKEIMDTETQSFDTVMNWQISTFLPKPVKPVFHSWVVEYIELMSERKYAQPKGAVQSTPRLTQLPFKPLIEKELSLSSQSQSQLPEDEVTTVLASFTKPLKKQISHLIRRHREESLHAELASDYTVPKLPGTHLAAQDPILQLTNSILQVFSLNKLTTLEVRLLRKELLSLFGVGEFSNEAHFCNPSASLKMPQVICNNCTLARDLDLCRNADLLPASSGSEVSGHGAASTKVWRCPACAAPFDRLALEESLLARVQLYVVQWATMDVVCVKCKRARINDFMDHCTCGGDWKGVFADGRQTTVDAIKVYGNVAEYYGLKMLAEVVGDFLKGL